MVYVVFIVLIFLLSPLFQFISTHPLVSLVGLGLYNLVEMSLVE